MYLKRLKLVVASLVVVCMPWLVHAESTADKFKVECNKAWMEGADKSTDKVAFKNFGEKYCACFGDKPLDDKDVIKKYTPVCMSQVLLRDTMDNIESDKGLANATQESIESTCNDEWLIINSGLNGITTPTKSAYCTCAAPKLNELTKNKDNVTDKEWYEKINTIAKDCSSH